MPTLLMFAIVRDASGHAHDYFASTTLDTLLGEAGERYGDTFQRVLDASRIWVNGSEADRGAATPLAADDEVAVIPPVAGG